LVLGVHAAPVSTQQAIRTQAEESGFKEYTRHANMMAYLRALQATTPEMKLSTYGQTWSGRELPYVIFSRPLVAQPWEAMASGKPIVLFQANVHGGERTQRESLMILMRELATPGTPANAWLDHIVLLIAPQVNPDGFEAQPGPTRGNQWGIDLNRDYIKLEQPEISNLVTNLYHKWYPHLIIDGHNGGARPYNINYITTANASVDPALIAMCEKEIFPLVKQRNEDQGLKTFYYPGGNAEYWNGAPHYPRIAMTYASFMNSLGITFESPGQDMETGVKSGVISYKAVLEYVVKNSAKVLATVHKARQDTIAMGLKPGLEVMVDMRQVDHDFTVSYEIADPKNQGQFITIPKGKLRTKPEVLKSRPRPWAYLLPPQAREAVALLRKHNITVDVLREPKTLNVQAYVLKDVRYRNEYDHQGAVVVDVAEVRTVERTFPTGTFVVSTAQVLGRLVAHLLEPESDDNVVLWNRMDAWLPLAQLRAAAPAAAGPDDDPAAAGRAGAAAQAAGGRAAGAGAGAGQGGRGGGGRGGGRGGVAQPPFVPIFKLMERQPLPTQLHQN
jgi:hypothetical protein